MRPNLGADDAVLLADCDLDTYRASGPGGHKRNKTESAVRLRHRSTSLIAIAEESRSQAENRARALRRLRKLLALRLREPAPAGVPEAVVAAIDGSGRLRVGRRDARYPAVVAVVLDVLQALGGSVGEAAARLGITTGNLSAFLTADADLLAETNRLRAGFGLRPLRPD
jgi:hypothetical protein